MKKTSYLILSGVVAASGLLTGCMQEPIDTDKVKQDQIETSTKALESSLWGMPATLKLFNCLNEASGSEVHNDWGIGSIMHIRDIMTEDLAIASSNYDHYTAWETNQAMGAPYTVTHLPFTFYTKYIQSANNVVASVDSTSATDEQLAYLGVALAYRAHAYLEEGQMYEYKPTDVFPTNKNTDGNDITELTVPIVTEKTTTEQAKNNPRVKKDTLVAFIEKDLNDAERFIASYNRPSKNMPDISVVYGLKARLYMWAEDYAKAEEYARMAIDLGANTPMTEAEWTSTTTGFNTIVSSWMWASTITKEDDILKTGIINWTSWMANETTFGYAGAGVVNEIGASLYAKINDRDFRKLSWKAPEGSVLSGREKYVDDSFKEELPEYASLKFRPGMGAFDDSDVGNAVSFPLMRIEEMYFIEAEAAAHQDAERGKALLEDFMKTYRYARYACSATTQSDIIDEIFLQKRIELWGEGLTYFDVKRLNKPVTRQYDGTNFYRSAQLNSTGTYPAWMNFVIPSFEANNNAAVKGYNNPDPSDKY